MTSDTEAGVEANRDGRGTLQGHRQISDRRGDLDCGGEPHWSQEEMEKRKPVRVLGSLTVGSLSCAAHAPLG